MQLILVINRRTRIECYANKFSTLIPIKPLGLIAHGFCFLGVNVFAIEIFNLSSAVHIHVTHVTHVSIFIKRKMLHNDFIWCNRLAIHLVSIQGLTLHSYTAVLLYMVHSPVLPFHQHRCDGINWLVHTTQTHLALACTQMCVDWWKFPWRNTTPSRYSPKSYRSTCPVHLALLLWYSGRTDRHSPRNMFLGFWKTCTSNQNNRIGLCCLLSRKSVTQEGPHIILLAIWRDR